MSGIPAAQLDRIENRHADITREMSDEGLSSEKFVKLSKEYAELTPVMNAARIVRRLSNDLRDAEAIVADSTADTDMRDMAYEEVALLKDQLPEAEHALRVLLLPKDAADDKPAMLEIRAGTGGEEAALFAGDLYRMYARYADLQGWKLEIISESAADMGGVKEVIASINGVGVFAKMKFESGVHRVQRVPATEAGGRIHTSAATVAVLPEPEDVDIQINDNDLRIDVYRSSGPGGQSVNTTDSAVRITHLPSGLVVIQQDEKSQHKNKAKALKVLRTRLYELERDKADKERADSRKSQVGSGDRSERIRTYNFPQGRVSDHRINLTLHKLDQILEGTALEEMIQALITQDQAERLAALDDKN
jgi:peptide chain release factor 1